MSFTFDKNYKNLEQVRPFLDEFTTIRAAMDAAGQFPYNDLFRGRIPGLAGDHEDTGIYLLQTLHQMVIDTGRRDTFLAEGGEYADTLDWGTNTRHRGTIAHFGFYVGGTGWVVYPNSRLLRQNGRYIVLQKGKRTNGNVLYGTVLINRHRQTKSSAA